MKMPVKTGLARLYEIAEGQQGYFTAKQAKECGFIESAQTYHAQAGNWVREHRGIYRLAHFPQTDQSHLALWSLWSRNRQEKPEGVYSHQTALAIHDLSDLMPSKLHMTVPRAFRRNSQIPKILVLHFGDLTATDIEARSGFRVTRPLRTIIDLLQSGEIPRETLVQALKEALSRGLITRNQMRSLPLDSNERRWVEELQAEIA
jgi:predicted transcriptional regulator of viral defense system